MPRRSAEALIRSIAYTTALATRSALPPVPARVLHYAVLTDSFFFSRSTGSPTRTVHTPLPFEVFKIHWSPDLEDHAIIGRGRSFDSASVRVEISHGSAPSAPSESAYMRSTAFRVQVGDSAAGPQDREQLPEISEGHARAMYDRIAEYVEEFPASLRIDVPDAVYTPCMNELRSVREGGFGRVTQSLENL